MAGPAPSERGKVVEKSLALKTLEALEQLPLVGWTPVQRHAEYKDHGKYMTARIVDGFKTLVQFLRKDSATLFSPKYFRPVMLDNGKLLGNTAVLPPGMIDSQFEVILERVTPLAPESTQFSSPYRLKVSLPVRGVESSGIIQVEPDGNPMAESLWEVLSREISEPSETVKRGEGSLVIDALAEALDEPKPTSANPSLV